MTCSLASWSRSQTESAELFHISVTVDITELLTDFLNSTERGWKLSQHFREVNSGPQAGPRGVGPRGARGVAARPRGGVTNGIRGKRRRQQRERLRRQRRHPLRKRDRRKLRRQHQQPNRRLRRQLHRIGIIQSIIRRKVGLRKSGLNTARNANGMRRSDGTMKRLRKRVDSGPTVIANKLVFAKEEKENRRDNIINCLSFEGSVDRVLLVAAWPRVGGDVPYKYICPQVAARPRRGDPQVAARPRRGKVPKGAHLHQEDRHNFSPGGLLWAAFFTAMRMSLTVACPLRMRSDCRRGV